MADRPLAALDGPATVHVVGVGGAGMSAIAAVLAAMGHRVSGSDLKDGRSLDRLRAEGVTVHVGHDAANLPEGVDLVAVSTAIPATNPEVVAATERGVRVLRRAEVLAAIAATRRSIAVAGTHGKTTTASMLALILAEAGLQPSFIIGGDLNEIGSGSAWGEGEWFVVEADESDGTFLALPREAALVTNIEPDHLEHHGSWDVLRDAFDRFAAQTSGPVVACADDPVANELAERHGASTYGTAEHARFRMRHLVSGREGVSFELHDTSLAGADRVLGTLRLPVAGEHNARNAAGAAVAALSLGAPFSAARDALGRFAGVARRFEHRGEVGGIAFVDDYAHLPAEVAAALAAARDSSYGRVVCVFQPHRYSRTAALWPQFADSFGDADLLAVTDVFAAGEAPRPGISGKLVVNAVLDAHPRQQVAYLPRRADLVAWLVATLRPGDLCLTLGAGDLTAVPSEVQDVLSERHAVGEVAGGRVR